MRKIIFIYTLYHFWTRLAFKRSVFVNDKVLPTLCMTAACGQHPSFCLHGNDSFPVSFAVHRASILLLPGGEENEIVCARETTSVMCVCRKTRLCQSFPTTILNIKAGASHWMFFLLFLEWCSAEKVASSIFRSVFTVKPRQLMMGGSVLTSADKEKK